MKTSGLERGFKVICSAKSYGLPIFFRNKNFLNDSRSCFFHSSVTVGDDPTAIASALSLSEKIDSSLLGSQIHGRVIRMGFSKDTFSVNNLIKMYSKCGVLAQGLKVFEEMPQRNLVSWTLMISASTEVGEFRLSLEYFLDMMKSGFLPNEYALGSVMKACAEGGAFEFGLLIHCLALKIGMVQNPFVGGGMLNMYAKSGDIESAELIFASMGKVDVGCWNSMIGGYAQCGLGFEALKILSSMCCNGVKMDHFTFINALKACSLTGNLGFGKELHGLILRTNAESSASVLNALMDSFIVNGDKSSALKIFDTMQSRDVVSWNIAFGGFSQRKDGKRVAKLFHEFNQAGMKPNHITFSVLFRLCGELLDLKLGLQFCSLALHLGFFDIPTLTSSIIDMFSRFGSLEMARLVFNGSVFKPVIAWNELISAYNLNSCYVEAIRTFSELWNSGVEASECSYSVTLEACYQSENLQMCRQVHSSALKSGFGAQGYVPSLLIKCYVKLGLLNLAYEFSNGHESLDLASWGTMISELVHQDHTYASLKVLNTLMELDEKPDEFIFGSILNGCSCITAYEQTRLIHSLVEKMGFNTHPFVASALIDAYAKCGDIKSAQMAFGQSSECNDTIVYNSMIVAYAQHGHAPLAMHIFEKMKVSNLQPTQATFVSLISACSHMGLVEQGRSFFEAMRSEYGIEPSPDIFGSLVDLLSRNGYLDDAKLIIESMPFRPWPAIFRSFLSGCGIYGNRELGEWATAELLRLVPKNDAAYALLSRVYSSGCSWENAAKVRRTMIDREVSKNPGYSWIAL